MSGCNEVGGQIPNWIPVCYPVCGHGREGQTGTGVPAPNFLHRVEQRSPGGEPRASPQEEMKEVEAVKLALSVAVSASPFAAGGSWRLAPSRTWPRTEGSTSSRRQSRRRRLGSAGKPLGATPGALPPDGGRRLYRVDRAHGLLILGGMLIAELVAEGIQLLILCLNVMKGDYGHTRPAPRCLTGIRNRHPGARTRPLSRVAFGKRHSSLA